MLVSFLPLKGETKGRKDFFWFMLWGGTSRSSVEAWWGAQWLTTVAGRVWGCSLASQGLRAQRGWVGARTGLWLIRPTSQWFTSYIKLHFLKIPVSPNSTTQVFKHMSLWGILHIQNHHACVKVTNEKLLFGGGVCCMCVYTCVCTCMCAHGGQRRIALLLYYFLPYFLEIGFSLTPESGLLVNQSSQISKLQI